MLVRAKLRSNSWPQYPQWKTIHSSPSTTITTIWRSPSQSLSTSRFSSYTTPSKYLLSVPTLIHLSLSTWPDLSTWKTRTYSPSSSPSFFSPWKCALLSIPVTSMHFSHSLGMIAVCGIGGRVDRSALHTERVCLLNGNGQSRDMSNLRWDRHSIGIATAFIHWTLGQ
jgi:hypothetical protein